MMLDKLTPCEYIISCQEGTVTETQGKEVKHKVSTIKKNFLTDKTNSCYNEFNKRGKQKAIPAAYRRDITMAEKITNAVALSAAIAIVGGAENPTEFSIEQIVEKLTAMHATATKPRKKSTAPSKDTIALNLLTDKVIAAMGEYGEPVNTEWLKNEFPLDIMTAQKATAVMRNAIKRGEVAKGEIVNKKVTYILA